MSISWTCFTHCPLRHEFTGPNLLWQRKIYLWMVVSGKMTSVPEWLLAEKGQDPAEAQACIRSDLSPLCSGLGSAKMCRPEQLWNTLFSSVSGGEVRRVHYWQKLTYEAFSFPWLAVQCQSRGHGFWYLTSLAPNPASASALCLIWGRTFNLPKLHVLVCEMGVITFPSQDCWEIN